MESVNRLNYIGSKYKLLDWIHDEITKRTGTLTHKTVADLFAGTGIVSFFLRTKGAIVKSNDAELYSYVITSALTKSVSRPDLIEQLNSKPGEKIGPVTVNYSPYNGNERKFFTVENAKRIDFLRDEISKMDVTDSDRMFLLASLLISADYVSNVPAVYGCYLKEFKQKALKSFILLPVHEFTEPPDPKSESLNLNVLDMKVEADIVYLDPPYNQRQYSKNYFPLNIIADDPGSHHVYTGKTGIPTDCFTSDFCKKAHVKRAFEKLVSNINANWIFVSYNNESLLTKDELTAILSKKGTVETLEKEYKRFKSFEYNNGDSVVEYLFCVNCKAVSGETEQI